MDQVEKGYRLRDEIVAEAERKAKRVLAKAQAEAGKILAEARKKAETVRQTQLERARLRAEAEKQRILKGTRLEIRKTSLAKTQEALDRYLPEAVDEVRTATYRTNNAWFKSELAKGFELMGADAARLSLSPALTENEVGELLAGLNFGGELQRVPALAPIEAVIESEDGSVRFEILIGELARIKQREIQQTVLGFVAGDN